MLPSGFPYGEAYYNTTPHAVKRRRPASSHQSHPTGFVRRPAQTNAMLYRGCNIPDLRDVHVKQ
jgi:hypothetical protein